MCEYGNDATTKRRHGAYRCETTGLKNKFTNNPTKECGMFNTLMDGKPVTAQWCWNDVSHDLKYLNNDSKSQKSL